MFPSTAPSVTYRNPIVCVPHGRLAVRSTQFVLGVAPVMPVPRFVGTGVPSTVTYAKS